MVDAFVAVLEKFLGVEAIRFSLAERWRQCPPSDADGRSITGYFAQVKQPLAIFALNKLIGAERILANVLQLLPYLQRVSE